MSEVKTEIKANEKFEIAKNNLRICLNLIETNSEIMLSDCGAIKTIIDNYFEAVLKSLPKTETDIKSYSYKDEFANVLNNLTIDDLEYTVDFYFHFFKSLLNSLSFYDSTGTYERCLYTKERLDRLLDIIMYLDQKLQATIDVPEDEGEDEEEETDVEVVEEKKEVKPKKEAKKKEDDVDEKSKPKKKVTIKAKKKKDE